MAKKLSGSGSVKMTVDLSPSVYNRFDDMYLEFRGMHRKLTRKDFLEFVIDYGLNYERLDSAIRGTKKYV